MWHLIVVVIQQTSYIGSSADVIQAKTHVKTDVISLDKPSIQYDSWGNSKRDFLLFQLNCLDALQMPCIQLILSTVAPVDSDWVSMLQKSG